MDFHSLTRKELQALCKLNKIPANITNIAMADSLAALQDVEGLEEFSNQSQTKPQNFLKDDTMVIGSPEAPRTSCRTSTRIRKPVNKEAPESSQPMSRTRPAMKNQSVVEETEVVNPERREFPPKTPAAPSTRRRVPPASAAKKMETRTDEIGSVQRAYSTRRAVRLLEQTLENLSIGGDVKIRPVKIDDFSNETDEKEASLEDKEDLKIDDSVEVHEEEDLVETQAEKMDIKDDTLVDEVLDHVSIAKISNEVENPIIKESQTDNSMAVEVYDEVKETVDETIPSDQSNLEVSESSLKEPANEEDSEYSVTLTSEEEESSKLETLIVKSLDEDSIANIGVELNEREEEETDVDSSEEEEETDEVSSKEEEEATESDSENSVSLTSEEEESSKLETLIVKSLDEDSIANIGAELNVTEEEETDEDSSKEEEETDEVSSEEEEEATESEVSDEDDVESDFESNLVDVNVVEAQIAIPSNDSLSRAKFDFVSEPIANEESKESSLIDVFIVQGQENKTTNGGSVSGSKIGPKTPFSADQLSGQFPRPSLPTPAKSSSKKAHPIIDIITDILHENEEEKGAEVKDEENNNGDKNPGTNLSKKSLRKLQKMLKSKLQIEKDKEEKSRIALQTLPENQIAGNVLQNEN